MATKKIGRPEHKPTEALRKKVRNMSIAGVPQDVIANAIGLGSKMTLRKYYMPEIEYGTAVATGEIAGKLYSTAMGGDTTAMIFWMKARAGWSDRIDLTQRTTGDIKLEYIIPSD